MNIGHVKIQGCIAAGYEPVAAAFQKNFIEHGEIGASFAAVVDGELVIDIWDGWADRARRRPWNSDTIAGIFSGTKGFVAACLLLLLERGQLDLNKPVCHYWPEFSAQGKENILVRHIVSHQVGLPGLITPVTVEEATDDVRMAQLLADQAPICEPGTRLYYHALTFGWLCGELIRRIDGRSVGCVFAEDVARPLRLDAWIGLPLEQENRIAVLERGPGFGIQDPAADHLAWSVWDNPPRFSQEPLAANTRSWRAAEIPAGNGMASARSVAQLYGCLSRGGEIGGVRILRSETIEFATQRLGSGIEVFSNQELAYGVGFLLQRKSSPFGKAAVAFGHDGAGGSMHGAWPELKTGFSFIPNLLLKSEGHDPRASSLLGSLYECVRSKHP